MNTRAKNSTSTGKSGSHIVNGIDLDTLTGTVEAIDQEPGRVELLVGQLGMHVNAAANLDHRLQDFGNDAIDVGSRDVVRLAHVRRCYPAAHRGHEGGRRGTSAR